MLIHPLVTDTDTLADLCLRLSEHDHVCIDTEFMRESTYYPELCLIQLASPDEAFAVDPLADNIDLGPFMELLANESVLKVLHAGSQDIEIFVNLTGEVPQPLFDTQIAAMAMGMGEQVSYANLVAHFTRHQIDKGARFTNWATRPLSERQISYAIGDVTWLSQLFPKMLSHLQKTERGEWLNEEMARLLDPSNYMVDPESMWQRIRLPNRKPETLGRLKALAAWRELEAQDKNVPRGRIMRDETLADLASSPPSDQEGLTRIRGLTKAWANNAIGDRLMKTLHEAAPLSATEIPAKERRPGLSSEASLIADLLKLLLKIRAKEEGIAPRLIARGEELEAIAGGETEGLPLLQGWRRDVFGEDALALVEGRLCFRVLNGQLKMQATEEVFSEESESSPQDQDGAPESDADAQ